MKTHDSKLLKKNNKSNVYKYILQSRKCSKNDIAFALGLSLPTVANNLKELMESGLVRCGGSFDSTGGRRANIFESVSDALVAIGVQILTDDVSIVECGLHGEVISSRQIAVKFEDSKEYFELIGQELQRFICSTEKGDRILGVTIALQGIVDESHQNLVYGRILNDSKISSSLFSGYIKCPCILMHDSEAAAFAASYFSPGIKDAVYLFLNKNLGSSTILNGTIYSGNHSRGAVLEHMCLDLNGEKCYCGKRGCAECYCSANALIKAAGTDLDTFFTELRTGNERMAEIWDEYLDRLAHTIYNIMMFQDIDVVLGGLVRNSMIDQDLEKLKKLVMEKSDFQIYNNSIVFEKNIKDSAAVGGALYHIKNFIDEF